MGCDYYIYTALKMIHKNGISYLNLSEKPVYIYGYDDDDTDDYLKHPSNRKPKFDPMEIENPDERIYTKNQPCFDTYLPQYRELIEEYIKYFAQDSDDYSTTNPIIRKLGMFDNPLNAECLKSFDDIEEIWMVELRGWRS